MARATEIKKGENFSVDGRVYKIADGLLSEVRQGLLVTVRQELFVKARQGLLAKVRQGLWVTVRRGLFALCGERTPAPTPLDDHISWYRLGRGRYVLHHRELYPCFDVYDRMHEKRCFRVFYLCRSMAEVREKHALLTSGRLFLSNLDPAEKHRDGLCPYVHFDDGRETFRVYENTED
jgi:hypothetical protein